MKNTSYTFLLKWRHLLPLLLIITFSGCRKFLEIPLPVNQVSGDAAFSNDQSAMAVVNNIFASMSAGNYFSGSGSIGFQTALYADDMSIISSNAAFTVYYTNALTGTTGGASWTGLYKVVYAANRAIEGVEKMSDFPRKNQALGEAYFSRALLHLYLAGVYGEIPVVTSSDFRLNNESGRRPLQDVYAQIIADGLKAKELLPVEYRNNEGANTDNRGRPNKAAASALLARAYLYAGDAENAEAEATVVINDPMYSMVPAEQAFLLNSRETIWGLAPPVTNNIIQDAALHYIAPGSTPVQAGKIAVLHPDLVASFETADARRNHWVGVSSSAGGDHYFAYKYKARLTATTPTEYIVMFRLAEQYLIRAEARALRGNLTGENSAVSDINKVRERALLQPVQPFSETEVMAAILMERRWEFFTEQGHRLNDLRRMNQLDAVMNLAAPAKGGTWTPQKQWWPIPVEDILSNPKLVQTPGYQ